MFVHAIFARSGRQNLVSEQNATREREKARLADGEDWIRTIECGALYRLAWPYSDTVNKALIGILASARFYRRVLKANSHVGCSTAMENVARDCSSVTFQFSC
jgi:uncharacterized C2H2 Zn-finger protein